MISLNKVRLLTPGPTEVPDRIRLAMAKPMIHHRKKEFVDILAKSQILSQKLFGTKEVVLPLTSSGTGAMTAAIITLFKPKEKVLVINIGKFGERWAQIAKSQNLEIIEHKLPWGKSISAKELESILDKDKDIKGVLLQICETSTGAQNKIEEIANITKNRDVMLVADGISAIGISPCPMDKWGVDCLLTGSQKGLMLPAGLALIALSQRAWQRAETIESTCFYFNLLKEKENCLKNQTNFSSPVSMIIGLHEALEMLFDGEQSLNNVYRKQWALTQMARHGAKALGFTLAAESNFAWGVTGLFMPKGLDSKPVVKMMQEDFNIIVTQGQAPMAEEMMRIGHMGWVDFADLCAGLFALAKSMNKVYNTEIPKGFLENSLNVYFDEYDRYKG